MPKGVPLRGWGAMYALSGCVNPIDSAVARCKAPYGASERPDAHNYPDPFMIINEGPLSMTPQNVEARRVGRRKVGGIR